MLRRELADAQWERIKELVPGKETDCGSTGRDNRLFVDAVLWIARTSSPWRDLPDVFGKWNRMFHKQNQTLPPYRHPLRENLHRLHSHAIPRRRHHLAAVTVNRA